MFSSCWWIKCKRFRKQAEVFGFHCKLNDSCFMLVLFLFLVGDKTWGMCRREWNIAATFQTFLFFFYFFVLVMIVFLRWLLCLYWSQKGKQCFETCLVAQTVPEREWSCRRTFWFGLKAGNASWQNIGFCSNIGFLSFTPEKSTKKREKG